MVSRSPHFIIEVEVEPYVAAHNTAGKDRILIELDGSGIAKILEFDHLEDHEIPEHLKGYYLDD